MAVRVFDNASVTINSVDLSDHVQSVEVSISAEDVDITAMGAAGRTRLAGLQDDSISVTFLQDFAAAEVDATLFPLVGAAAFTVAIRADAGSASTVNPTYTASCILTEYTPITGDVGAAETATVTFAVSGAITRATS